MEIVHKMVLQKYKIYLLFDQVFIILGKYLQIIKYWEISIDYQLIVQIIIFPYIPTQNSFPWNYSKYTKLNNSKTAFSLSFLFRY